VVNGQLTNLRIENNRIRNMGLCGIGPIGFFNLGTTQEVVTVNGLWIVANEITQCVNRTLTQYTDADTTSLGYGGICLPDVTATFIRDNLVLNTGASLADPVSGIFILHGEQVEISRNQIQDTRNWSTADANTLTGYRAGISLVMVTPQDAPAAAGTAWTTNTGTYLYSKQSLYEHGAPALCIQENVVDIPLGLALVVAGLGAFSISGNHFSTGGARAKLELASSVLIFNFGTPVEFPTPVTTTAELLALIEAVNGGATTLAAIQTVLGSAETIVGAIAPGPVLFSQNRCALHQTFEAAEATAAIWISTFDDLGFHDNQCWMATAEGAVAIDVWLTGVTVRVTGCRFQEIPGSVIYSAVAFALTNIVSLNDATHALVPLGGTQSVFTGNVTG
jgi:hypothetical protein